MEKAIVDSTMMYVEKIRLGEYDAAIHFCNLQSIWKSSEGIKFKKYFSEAFLEDLKLPNKALGKFSYVKMYNKNKPKGTFIINAYVMKRVGMSYQFDGQSFINFINLFNHWVEKEINIDNATMAFINDTNEAIDTDALVKLLNEQPYHSILYSRIGLSRFV